MFPYACRLLNLKWIRMYAVPGSKMGAYYSSCTTAAVGLLHTGSPSLVLRTQTLLRLCLLTSETCRIAWFCLGSIYMQP